VLIGLRNRENVTNAAKWNIHRKKKRRIKEKYNEDYGIDYVYIYIYMMRLTSSTITGAKKKCDQKLKFAHNNYIKY
jgi:hypothetical protein